MSNQSAPNEWMVVYSTYSLPEAYIVAGRLQVEGIPAFVHQQAGAQAFGITIGSLGEVTVLVNSEQYQQALDILEEPDYDELPDNTDDITYQWDEDEDDNEQLTD